MIYPRKRGDILKGQDKYKEPITIVYPNMIATVHFPDLTENERKRRMSQIYAATANLLKER